MTYHVELVWNRETAWVIYGPSFNILSTAISFAQGMENSGDGMRVKKTRVLDHDGNVCWANGKLVGRE